MIGNWNLPKELLELEPIGKDNSKMFYGRDAELKELKRIMIDSCVAIIEGEAGVGKTSIGNKIRFEDQKRLTPVSEIKCQPEWRNFNFLIEIQSHILGEIYRDGSKFSSLINNPKIQSIYNRNSTQEFRSLNMSIGGFGGGMATSISQQAQLPEASLYEEINYMIKLLKNFTELEDPIILQVNNLDLHATFSREQLERFLNAIRDTLQIKGINFLLIGTEGLFNVIQSYPRLKQIVRAPIFIDPFSLKEIIGVLNKRIEESKYQGQRLPFEENLLNLIYTHTGGSTREVINELRSLLDAFKDDTLIKTITITDASLHYSNKFYEAIQKIFKNETSKNIILEVKKSPGIIQTEIVNILDVTQGTVSAAISKLIERGIILKKDNGGGYYLSPSYELALNNLKIFS